MAMTARRAPARTIGTAAVRAYLAAIDDGDFDDALTAIDKATGHLDLPLKQRLIEFCAQLGEQCLLTLRYWYGRDGISVDEALARVASHISSRKRSAEAAKAAVDFLRLMNSGRESKARDLLARLDAEQLGQGMVAIAMLTLEHEHAIQAESSGISARLDLRNNQKAKAILKTAQAVVSLGGDAAKKLSGLQNQLRSLAASIQRPAVPSSMRPRRRPAARAANRRTTSTASRRKSQSASKATRRTSRRTTRVKVSS